MGEKFLSRTLRRSLRGAVVALGEREPFRALGRAVYRDAVERYAAELRRDRNVLELWILGSGAEGAIHPGASDLDFLVVLDDGAEAGPLLERFRRRFFLYPAGTEVEHLSVFSRREWNVFRPVFADPRTGRARPIFGGGAPDRIPDGLAYRDVYYRLVGLVAALEPSVHRSGALDGLGRRLFRRNTERVAALLGRLAALGAPVTPETLGALSPGAWLAKVLRSLAVAERAAVAYRQVPDPGEPPRFEPPAVAPRSEWGRRTGAALSRHGAIDHWIVDDPESADVEALIDEYRGTDRRLFVHDGPGFDRLHGNYPLRPTTFWDFAAGRWVGRERRFDRERTHLEALRHYGRYRAAGIPEASATLRALVQGGGGTDDRSAVPVERFALQGSSRWSRDSVATSAGPGHSPAPELRA